MTMKRIGTLVLTATLMAVLILAGCVENAPVSQVEVPVYEKTSEEVESEVSDAEAVADKEESQLFTYIDETKIDSERSMNIIRDLTSAEYEGRKAGTETGHLAEDYIAGQFEEIGLEAPESLGGYKQLYPQKIIYAEQPSELSIVGSDEEFSYQIDFTERSMIGYTYYDADVTAELLYIENKGALDGESSEFDDKIIVTSDKVFYEDRFDFLNKVDMIQKNGANVEGIIVAVNTYGPGGLLVNRSLKGDENESFDEEDPFMLHVTYDVFDKLKIAYDEGKSAHVMLDYEVKHAEPANIVGVIPGKNEDGENETLIIGAHMDHVGGNLNGTYNPGALDNASGVATILELARVVKESGQPENTIVFVAFNGEEDGLRGSKYFVENPPVEYDIRATEMINFDMVGSINDLPLTISADTEFCFELRKEMVDIADELGVENISQSIGGSDQVRFTNHSIPSILLIHDDMTYIHTYMDTIDNAISKENLESVIRLGLAFIDQAAYQDN